MAHAYFGRRIFSKFFGGKNSPHLIRCKLKIKKNWSMRSLSTRIFFISFLAGKSNFFKQPMPWILSRQKKIRSPIKSRDNICLRLASSCRF